ncbi:MAG: PLDc N-terminal domain-containing protein [Rhodoglobus sp.]
MLQIVLSVITLALMIFALVEVITSENWQIQHLPKVLWILLIIILPLIGSVIWIIVGKDRSTSNNRGTSNDRRSSNGRGPFTNWNTSGDNVPFGDPRRNEPPASSALDDDEAIEQEIAYHEKQAEIRRLEAELRSRRGDQQT